VNRKRNTHFSEVPYGPWTYPGRIAMRTTPSPYAMKLRRDEAVEKLLQLQHRIATIERITHMSTRLVGWTDRVTNVPFRSSKQRLEDIMPMKIVMADTETYGSNGQLAFMLYKRENEVGFVLFVEETEVCLAMDLGEIADYYEDKFGVYHPDGDGLDKLTNIIEQLENRYPG
jgi:hypothetical protein